MAVGNSFAEAEREKRPDFEERKKDIVQYDGVKQVKKKPENQIWKWVKDMFFSGRTLKEILIDVAENQIVPQVKDNVRNAIVSFVDLGIYKDSRSASSSGTPNANFITNYVNFSDKASQQKKALESNQQKEKEVINSGYETPAFPDRKKADDFIRSLHAYVTKYQTLSVQELAWMQRKVIDYTWDKYGWEKEEILEIKEPTHLNNPETPWAVMFPKAHVLN